jgi:hypothetical protein
LAWIKNYEIAQQLPLFLAVSLLGALTLLDELLSGTTVLLMEITDGLFVNLFLFASNLLTLWNIAGLYMIMMLSCKGWCISRPIISNAEKQFTILIGCSMMLVEVILLGSTHVYAIGLLIAYLFVARVFRMELSKVLKEIDRQISSFEVSDFNETNSTTNEQLIKVLNKKRRMMVRISYMIGAFLIGNVGIVISRYRLQAFYSVLIEETCRFILFVTIFYIFKPKRPIKIHLSVRPDGRLAVIQPTRATLRTVEMVCPFLT